MENPIVREKNVFVGVAVEWSECSFSHLAIGKTRCLPHKHEVMAMPKTFGFTAYRRKQALNPDRSLERLSIILFFSSLPVHFSFACWASCLSYSLDVARYAFKNKTGNMLNNQTKSAQALTTDLG